jgi:hypothetical protein
MQFTMENELLPSNLLVNAVPNILLQKTLHSSQEAWNCDGRLAAVSGMIQMVTEGKCSSSSSRPNKNELTAFLELASLSTANPRKMSRIQSWKCWSYLGRDIWARILLNSKRKLTLVRSSSTANSSFMIALVDCSSMALPNTRLLLKPPALPCSMPWTWASQSLMLSIMMDHHDGKQHSSQIETNVKKRSGKCHAHAIEMP